MNLILPQNYDPRLSVRQTQEAIKYIRDTFQKEFGRRMNLERISAPLFVEKSSGLNDDLNGVERPVAFDMAAIPDETIEVVHSFPFGQRMHDFRGGIILLFDAEYDRAFHAVQIIVQTGSRVNEQRCGNTQQMQAFRQ